MTINLTEVKEIEKITERCELRSEGLRVTPQQCAIYLDVANADVKYLLSIVKQLVEECERLEKDNLKLKNEREEYEESISM